MGEMVEPRSVVPDLFARGAAPYSLALRTPALVSSGRFRASRVSR